MHNNNKNTFKFTLSIISLCLLVLVLGLFAVAHIYKKSAKQRDLQFTGDAFINYRLKPNQTRYPGKGWFHSDDRVYNINSLGLRGRDVADNHNGIYRIAVLGGSGAYDIYVSDEQTFAHRIQQILSEKTGRQIEVINAGTPGWSTVHSLTNYMFRIRYLKPDLIIVYHTWNDIKYFKHIKNGFDMPEYFRTYDEKSKQAYLSGDFPFAQIDAIKMLLISAKARLKGETVVENSADQASANLLPAGESFDATLFKNSLTDLVRLARHDGVSVLLATQANLAHENTTESDRQRIMYSFAGTDHDGLVRAIGMANDAIFEVAENEKVPVVDAYNEMLGKSEYFGDHIHLSRQGCEQLAIIMGEKIIAGFLNNINKVKLASK